MDDYNVMAVITEGVLKGTGLSLIDVRRDNRTKPYLSARWGVAKALKEHGYTPSVIADFMHKDRTTVLNMLKGAA